MKSKINSSPFITYAFLTTLALGLLSLTACSEQSANLNATATPTKAITVYKSPTCACCTTWEEHLTMEGFKVTSEKRHDMTQIKKNHGVKRNLTSCHTAIIEGYVIEGHVPASDIRKLLAQRPKGVVGLTAPGMPQKSPGMQPHGKEPKGYDVLSFDKNGKTELFTSYR